MNTAMIALMRLTTVSASSFRLFSTCLCTLIKLFSKLVCAAFNTFRFSIDSAEVAVAAAGTAHATAFPLAASLAARKMLTISKSRQLAILHTFATCAHFVDNDFVCDFSR
jgi:hypothetical protein